jgi:hypothetical protein
VSPAETSEISTKVPARLDRLPWSRWHWMIVFPDTALAFCSGAVLMILGGIAELILGVRAERRSLEDIARPLTAAGRSSDPRQDQLRTATCPGPARRKGKP